MHQIFLACPHHDPNGRLYDQTERMLPFLARNFAGIAVDATNGTQPQSIALLEAHGARIQRRPAAGHLKLGLPRRGAVQLALSAGAETILFCDFDRLLHWAEYHPDELLRVAGRLPEHDFTVLGRTERAFASHPRVQTETERIVNEVFGRVSGLPWDITAAARGLRRPAAAALVAGCDDETIGTDGSWPLFLQRAGGFTLGAIATEGLEFETPDRYPQEVAEAGGRERWTARLDDDPRAWAQRLDMARVEVEAMVR